MGYLRTRKKLLFLAAIFFILSLSNIFLISADQIHTVEPRKDLSDIESQSDNPGTETESGQQDGTLKIPDWLKRINYGLTIESHQKPRIYVEMVQPLWESVDKRNTFFTHDRISIQDERGTYSLGYGYRRLLFNENLLIGINNFFDYQDLHRHYRGGLGLEFISKILEFRTNSYFGISRRRKIEETSSQTTYERVASGGDIELGAPIPFLPWFKLFYSYYRYDFKHIDNDMYGWKLRGEIKPSKYLVINLETYDDNKGEREYRFEGRFSLAFDTFAPKSLIKALKTSPEAFVDTNLKERTLERVERNFNIQVEKWVETAGMTIEIGRGN